MADIVNGRCHNEKAPDQSPPLIQNGKLILQMHHIGWLVSGCFTIAATVISFWLMNKHLRWYTNKAEQRYIVRILLMVPIYATVSFASYLFWNHSTPLLLLRDCYESTVLTSFFYLLLLYLSPHPEEQKEIFRKHGLSRRNDRDRVANGEAPKKWMFPLNSVIWKPEDGLHFLQLMKWGILQYCVVRPGTTLAAVILDYVGLYCEDSWSPGWGHIYITTVVSVSVSVAMYCLIQLYMPISTYLAPQKPLLKLFAIKAVVFLTFWQASFLSMLATFGLVKDTKYMTAENINIGIGAIVETVEMTLFALLHLKAFSYKPYAILQSPTRRVSALLHAFNFMETAREVWAGMVYMWCRFRGKETDVLARRQAVLEGVFGKSRIEIQGGARIPTDEKKRSRAGSEKDISGVRVAVEETIHIEQERQWLGTGDDYAYGLGYHTTRTREKSEALEEQIERELMRRGYGRREASDQRRRSNGYNLLLVPEKQQESQGHSRGEQSWWRNVYNRISHSEPSPHQMPESEPYGHDKTERRRSRRASKRPSVFDPATHTYDDPPPPSTIRKYRESKTKLFQPDTARTLLPGASANGGRASLKPSAQSHLADEPGMSVTRPSLATVHDLRSPPSNSAVSLPSTSTQSDSFLARAFVAHSDASLSAETMTGGATSTQSHRSQVRLTVGPEYVASSNRKAVTRKPVRYPAPDVLPAVPMSARIEESSASPIQLHASTTGNRVEQIPSRSYQPQTTGPGDTLRDSISYQVPGLASTRRYVPRRDEIVLPAPLALTASHSLGSYPLSITPTQQSISPLQQVPADSPTRAHVSAYHVSPNAPRGSATSRHSGPSQLRRSQHSNMRRNSHAFSQHPSPTSSAPVADHRGRRFSAPPRQYPILEASEPSSLS